MSIAEKIKHLSKKVIEYMAPRRKLFKYSFLLVMTVLVFYSALFTFRYFIPARIVPGGFVSGIVDTGPVLCAVEAEGIVAPENEVFLRAYSSGVVKKIVNSPGSHIKAGDILLLLDTDQVENEIENDTDQLDVMKNNLWKNRLNATSTKVDLEYNMEMKKLNITSLKSDLTDQEQLLEVGGISPAKIEKTRQELVIADMELKTTQQKNTIRLKQLDAEEEGLLLQIAMKEKEIEEKKVTLSKMTVRAPSAGIVLNIYKKEGEKVNSDELLAQISNMTSFKINASIKEDFADIVKTGGDVTAKVNTENLEGKIGRVLPVIENNKVNFEVFLEQSSHPDLIPNLKVNIRVATARKDSVLRISKGEAFNNSEKQYVYVVKGSKANRKEIITGLKGNDFMEIISGVNVGDIIITSDISSFRHMREVEIEN
jgi:HlyD family secretion protein